MSGVNWWYCETRLTSSTSDIYNTVCVVGGTYQFLSISLNVYKLNFAIESSVRFCIFTCHVESGQMLFSCRPRESLILSFSLFVHSLIVTPYTCFSFFQTARAEVLEKGGILNILLVISVFQEYLYSLWTHFKVKVEIMIWFIIRLNSNTHRKTWVFKRLDF